jgi:enterochelin esterase-like enzyme
MAGAVPDSPRPADGATAVPQAAAGRLVRLASLTSRHVAPRHVDVWLPPGYEAGRPHAVLYLHDGQMLWDARTTWNGQCWEVPQTAARLIAEGRTREFIVVGIWNSGATRFADYFPQGFLRYLPEGPARQALVQRGLQGAGISDAYLRFLVGELKPAIDARFRTDPSREATFIGGSSMGGLISVYAVAEYPEVFGGVAALSTHWIGHFERNDEIPGAAIGYLRQHLPPSGRHRWYFDRGTADLDALYDVAQGRVDALMRELGFTSPLLLTRVFEGEGHNERAWARRLELPLLHLLGS